MSQGRRRTTQAVEAAIEPLLEAHGFELVLVEYVPRSRILRIYVDHQHGVSLDDCTNLSRRISDLLDAEGVSDGMEDRYTLEVSSPGLDRPLVKPSHFRRFIGHVAQVQTTQPRDGRRRFRGELLAADDEGIQIDVDGTPRAIGYDAIARARLVPDL